MVRKACVVIGILFLAQCAAAQADWRASKLADSGGFGWSYYDDNPVYSVAISADGTTAVVGGSGAGAARVFTRSGSVWAPQSGIPVGSDAVLGAQAYSVAISADGNTAIVGGPDDASSVGAAWVFTRSGGLWSQQGAKLVGSGANGAAFQGRSVAISADGTTAVVGGPWDAIGAGAAWVFTRSGEAWSQQGIKLQGTGTGAGQSFQGISVAISGDGNTVIVGGYGDNSGAGAAWVFTRTAGVWSQQGSKLVGGGAVGNAYQGISVAISGDGNTAIVGGYNDNSGAGTAWVFTRSGGVWSQQGPRLVGTGAVGKAGQGGSVAISADGNTAIVGGSSDDSGSGATWVFTRSNGAWAQNGNKLVGSSAVGLAYQGTSVAVAGDGATFLVGGPGDGTAGAAWVFSNAAFAVWIPAAAHTSGFNQTTWRSDLGLLNPGTVAANVQLSFFGSTGVVSDTVLVPAGAQSILTDVVGQLGASGQGSIEIVADQSLKLTARTYNQSPPDAGCFPNGTQGQSFPVLTAGGGLGAGQSAHLPGLVQNADYRSNIGLVNTGEGTATVLVELFDGAGAKLAEYTVVLTHGQWAQENRPFEKKAGATSLDRGYARITVQSGSGVYAFATVIDNVTNDPTTVAMQR
ncbi:MAG TPA: hypothetical protein VMT45_15220 [Thermoanaerobaculaceae bacterium]|nr:hypothetical protein [Thermoanaerobaculaceae bacterium]